MRTMKGFDAQMVTLRAEALVSAYSRLKQINPQRKDSGYLTISDKNTGQVILIWKVGEMTNEKADKYFNISREKAARLFEKQKDGHVSSFQSRDVKNEKWGGAIIAGEFIVSFSGLPELMDEAVCLSLALAHGWLSLKEVEDIKKLSANKIRIIYFRRPVG